MKPDNHHDLLSRLDDDQPPETFEKFIKPASRRRPERRPLPEEVQFVQSQDDTLQSFAFTYQAARYEKGWMLQSLGPFYERRFIDDVLRKLKGGKEASVYQCLPAQGAPDEFIAAKVYRPRQFRNLKNDRLYRMGRGLLDENGVRIVDEGALRAERRRTTYGEQVRHTSWIAYEFQALKTLHAAGADVPRPYEMGENAILMGYIGGEELAAPTLNTVTLKKKAAAFLFERVLRNIELMLAHDIVHADLSAYNILYWQGFITLIDFPQVISPRNHPHAWDIFARDLRRVCEYFASQGLKLDPAALAADLWQKHGFGERGRWGEGETR